MSASRSESVVQRKPWAIPLSCVAAAAVLFLLTAAIDKAGDYGLVSKALTGTATTAQSNLGNVAVSMMTLITIVLSVLTVAVQLAMQQFSPRIVNALLRDRGHQLGMGLFGATCVFAFLATIPIDDQSDRVPGVTVLVAYALFFASLVGLVLYVHHSGQQLRVAALVDIVGDNLRAELERGFPRAQAAGAVAAGTGVVPSPVSGVVTQIDRSGLVAAAARADCVLELVPMMGDFVPAGAPLLRVRGPADRLDRSQLTACVGLGQERSHSADPAFGFRKLVDIAMRTASDDPTTSVQAIDRLHDCLRQIADRPFPTGRHRDAQGTVRLVERTLGWEGFVRLSFDEVRLEGAAAPQIARRLRAALLDLLEAAPPERREPLEHQLERLSAAAERALDDDADLAASRIADQQGIGSGEDIAGRPSDADDAFAGPDFSRFATAGGGANGQPTHEQKG